MHRVLDYYLHTAADAALRFTPSRPPPRLDAPQPGVVQDKIVDRMQAITWFEVEMPVLLALVGYADTHGFDSYVWQICWALSPFFSRRGRGRDFAASQKIALGAAQRLNDPVALAHTRYQLAYAQSHIKDWDAAEQNVRQALDMFRELGDRANEAVALNGVAAILAEKQSYAEALAVELNALGILKEVGHWPLQATMENSAGWLYAVQGQYHQALSHCRRALSLHQESDYRGGAADTLDSLGYIYFHMGNFTQAVAYYEKAVEAYREIGSPSGESNSLTGLCEARLAAGQTEAARDSLQQALTILRGLLLDDPGQLKIRLAELETQLAPIS